MSASYDLTATMAPYLDAHLMLSLLDALKEQNMYDKDVVLRQKIKVIARTNMVELGCDLLSEVK